MKKIILSSAFGLAIVFGISTAFTNVPAKADMKPNKQLIKLFGPHWNSGPCYVRTSKNAIVTTGFAAGLADGPLSAEFRGSYACVNNGGQCPDANQWQNLHLTDVRVTKKNSTGGNAKLTIEFNSLCSHANWTFQIKDLEVRIYDPATDATVIDWTDVEPCNPTAYPCDL